MRRAFELGHFLTSAKGWEAVFLTLLVLLNVPKPCAADDGINATGMPLASDPQPVSSPLDDLDKTHRTAMLWQYVRQQAPVWAPGLNDTLHKPLGWLQSAERNVFDDGASDSNASAFQPISMLMQAPPENAGQAMWLTPGYHHKGFLPFHDAMMTGMDMRQRVFDNRLQFDLKPYYGQNWTSLNGYGGAALGIGLTHPGEAQPWGRVSMGYIEGASELMDNGRGYDMHAELRFDDSWSFHAGVRNENTSDLGNYAIMRWKLMSFGP